MFERERDDADRASSDGHRHPERGAIAEFPRRPADADRDPARSEEANAWGELDAGIAWGPLDAA